MGGELACKPVPDGTTGLYYRQRRIQHMALREQGQEYEAICLHLGDKNIQSKISGVVKIVAQDHSDVQIFGGGVDIAADGSATHIKGVEAGVPGTGVPVDPVKAVFLQPCFRFIQERAVYTAAGEPEQLGMEAGSIIYFFIQP